MTETGTKTALWEQQFDTAFDFPSTPILTKYVVCTSPRSGSHHLGHLLHRAGGFGYPLEYMNSENLAVWARRARACGVAAPLAYIKSVRTDHNGVFGIKVHYSHLSTFLRHEHDVVQYRFITLERRDLLKQAVSYSWAAQTKSWISGMPAVRPALYDWESVASKLAEIARSNAGWRKFLAALGIGALHLVHEDVRANPEATINQVAAFLGTETSRAQTAQTAPRFVPAEQAEPAKEEWVRRFIEDSRARLAGGQLIIGERQRRPAWFSALRASLAGRGHRESPTR